MITSGETDKINEALALAQGEFLPMDKTGSSNYGKYSTLADIFKATRPSLSKNGLSISQFPQTHENRAGCITRLNHKSGQFYECQLMLKSVDTPQGAGSAITYAKRYSVASILGVDGEIEDDGNAAVDGDDDKQKQDALSAQLDSIAKANEKKLFDAEFMAKVSELKVDKKLWDELYKRLVKSKRKVAEMQNIIDEIEIENNTKKSIENA